MRTTEPSSTPSAAALRVAAVVPVTTAEGPHARFAVWVQGCTLGCPGCCNPRMLPPGRAPSMEVEQVLRRLDHAMTEHALEGITVLGGEPLQQLPAVAALCRGAAARGLGVLVFTGYSRSEAQARPGFASLWPYVDTLVEGRYDRDQPEPEPHAGGRRFIGSRNQGLWHRTDRYRDPALWHGEPALEVRLGPEGGLSAHGEPMAVAALLRALSRATQ